MEKVQNENLQLRNSAADEAINSIRESIKSLYGDKYLPKSPHQYVKKVKNAQEAHEVIHPTDSAAMSFSSVGSVSQSTIQVTEDTELITDSRATRRGIG
jgi:DNA topoisomerase IA